MTTHTQALSLEERAQREQTLDRLEARMEALQFSLRSRRESPWSELWWHDLRATRATWLRLVDPDHHPTRKRS